MDADAPREEGNTVAFTGLTTDVPVRDVAASRDFYQRALGRSEDLVPEPGSLEWVLHAQPQIALRVVQRRDGAGTARVGIGVDDLAAERERLEKVLGGVPEVIVVPAVIALLELRDDDGNRLVFWQDLLPRRR